MCLGESSVNLQNQWKRRRAFRKPDDMFTNRNLYLGEKVFAFLRCKLSPPSLVNRKKRSIKFNFGFKIHKDKQRIKDG